jgi:hypothetical protein
MRVIQLIDGIMWRISRRKRVDELWIGAYDKDTDLQIARVVEALDIIKLYDSRRYKTIMRDLKRIWVLPLPGPLATFHVETWSCRIDQRFVVSSPIRMIASVIVHEAAHARLFRRGIDYNQARRAQVEAVCTRQQAAFAAKIPLNEDLQSHIRAHLALDASTWTNENLETKHVQGSISLLRHMGMPEWAVRWFVYRRRRRYRRQT